MITSYKNIFVSEDEVTQFLTFHHKLDILREADDEFFKNVTEETQYTNILIKFQIKPNKVVLLDELLCVIPDESVLKSLSEFFGRPVYIPKHFKITREISKRVFDGEFYVFNNFG
jgi:hypothetical protein